MTNISKAHIQADHIPTDHVVTDQSATESAATASVVTASSATDHASTARSITTDAANAHACTRNIVLQAKGLSRHYDDGQRRLDILKGVDLSIASGEMVAIIGASGSGKSTLLHCLGLLDRPDAGEVYVNGQATNGLNEVQRSRLRNKSLGFVYQFHHLLGEFTALDNVAMPLIVRRLSRNEARTKAHVLLERVGLGDRMTHYPSQLSGGERQRVALARAMVTEPSCVLADEPTGNLDRETAEDMFNWLRQAVQAGGTSLVVVTHDLALAARADRQFTMTSGLLAVK
jgi:lipoprotein-releasing system ATP-binding protein